MVSRNFLLIAATGIKYYIAALRCFFCNTEFVCRFIWSTTVFVSSNVCGLIGATATSVPISFALFFTHGLITFSSLAVSVLTIRCAGTFVSTTLAVYKICVVCVPPVEIIFSWQLASENPEGFGPLMLVTTGILTREHKHAPVKRTRALGDGRIKLEEKYWWFTAHSTSQAVWSGKIPDIQPGWLSSHLAGEERARE